MHKIAHFIVQSKAAAYIAALLYIVMWSIQTVQAGGFSLLGCMSLLLTLGMGYFMMRMVREFSLGDAKGALPATFFFMSCAIAPVVSPLRGDGMHFILFFAACYTLLRTYRRRNAMGSYFLAFVLVGIQCLLLPSCLLMLPLLVLCGTFMESLHVRTFFAALWGLLFSYWVAGGVLFLTDRVGLIAPYFAQVLPVMSDRLGMPQLLQLLWVLLLVLPGGVAVLFNRTMRLQANASYRLLLVALVVLLVAVCLLPAHHSALLPCALLYSSVVGAALFTGNKHRAKNIYLIVLLLLWLFFLSQPVWINYTMH